MVILDITAEPIFTWFQRRRHKRTNKSSLYAGLEWSATNILQLQRLAHEGAGYGKWDRCSESNPVTAAGNLLAQLDLQDAKHPILKPKAPYEIERVDTVIDMLVEEAYKGKQ